MKSCIGVDLRIEPRWAWWLSRIARLLRQRWLNRWAARRCVLAQYVAGQRHIINKSRWAA